MKMNETAVREAGNGDVRVVPVDRTYRRVIEVDWAWQPDVAASVVERPTVTPMPPHANDSPTPERTKEPYYLTVPQIAVRWNVSERTVWRLISTKELPSVRFGSLRRVLEEDVERFEASARAVA